MKALLGTLVFTILVPGAFVIGLPIMLGISSSTPGFVGSRTAGLLLILAGVAIYVWAATAFVLEGKGTPSPTAPPTQFVAVGPYRYVRNPIYIGELIVVAGLAAILGSALVLIYAGGLFAVLHMFIVTYEEPGLRRRFGSAYDGYVREVDRWLPFGKIWRRKST